MPLARTLILTALVATSLAWAAPVNAWDGTVSGKITRLDANPNSGGSDFRVYLQSFPAMRGSGTAGWAYLNKSMTNYDAAVAQLLTAYAMTKTVTLYSNIVSGYCEIGYVAIED